MKLDALQKAIGHRFSRLELLQQAVTHRSFGSPHNERLEFLGDSIVNCVTAIALFERFGELREGDMSRLRANLVRQEALYRLADGLKLGDYLPAHGFKIIDSPALGKASLNEANLTDTLVSNAGTFHTAIARLNWLAQQASSKKVLEIADPTLQKSDPGFDRIMDYVRDAGLATLSKDTIRFRDEAARAYLNGGWLEQYVFDIANSLKKQDIACNLTVESQAPGHSRNEIDVAILAQNRLHVIECKTSRLDQSDRADGVLYKLDTLTAFGGLNTKGMLVSFQPLKAPDLSRAKDLRVKVVDADKLRNLKQIMNEWINSR